jgi:hypothetical protein
LEFLRCSMVVSEPAAMGLSYSFSSKGVIIWI